MHLADAAWREVDVTTIHHCWRKAGILPEFAPGPSLPAPTIPVASLLHNITTENPVSQAESAVTWALDDLVKTGALQVSNRMDINSLLNPAAEVEAFSEILEEEIFNAVRDSAQEEEEDTQEEEEELPSPCDALQAAAVLIRFTGTMNDPVAQRLEEVLAGFSRQLRVDSQKAMASTSITDYFRHE